MSVLVLGGAGYIGSHTVKELLEKSEKVVVLDNLSTGYEKAVDKRAIFYKGDIADKALILEICKKEDVESIIHFAAYSLVGESVNEPLKYYENNLSKTRNLLEAAIEARVSRFVFSSTAATYGEPESVPILESDKTEPTNPYGETKLAMEKMFRWASEAYGIKFVSLRYFNACGADLSGNIGEAHKPESHLIPLILQVPNKQRQAISIFGTDYNTHDGTCVRDYIHVTDLSCAHILALEYLRKNNKNLIVNLGNGQGFSVREVIEAARKVTGHAIPIIESPRRAGDPAILIASSELAKKELGWTAECEDLEEIIASAWNWHKKHPKGYEE